MCRAALVIAAATLAVAAGCDQAKTVLKGAIQTTDTHEALYGSMLSCQEEVCGILESIHSVEDARAAEPRLSAQAKTFRDYGNRFLLLGLPDAKQTQQLVEQYGERQVQLSQRESQALANLEGNQNTMLAVMTALDELAFARTDFELKRGALRMAKATGQPTTGAEAAQIQQHEQILALIATRLKTITGVVAAMNDGDSAKQQVGPLEGAVAAVQMDIEKFRTLPQIHDVQLQIRLDPARQRVGEAFQAYSRTAEAARQRPGVLPQLLKHDIRLTQAIQQLAMPQMPPGMLPRTPAAGPGESAGARKAREMMEAARAGRAFPASAQPPRTP
jgi:hypothetical protein